ncbi:MAG TPA: UDP-N-acetylglucosamine 2-epimerase (non-hydrolyzing) [candidate division WOR-3 bacterium]|uniref:UDP-N-acetylglucosamine 2-epimerase (non-hydrolyzing) n=1 Tax=candidate division WOR-3 bacterium TaxID=2052148 RepID=A0A7V0T6J3_UNCW3|nr:UDP-N-acetylglucosamine 2-epimerase (non-hydrolyzing) [candidate division WOR-3 bacterium]
MKVLLSFGTRPEAIKLAPLVRELKHRADRFETVVLVTAQHRTMLDQVLDVFDIRPDHDLDIMKPGQSLGDVTVRALLGVEKVLERERPDWVIVQGDTTSVFVSALAAYYRRIRVGHVEAGLRTADKFSPYPEEMNRRLAGVLADLHFAPTPRARDNLLHENVPPRSIHVTGNTVIDALLATLASPKRWRVPVLERVPADRRVVLVTAHRRESFGAGFENICRALAVLAERNPDVEIIYPVHLNPNVRGPVMRVLRRRERVHLIEPIEYLPFAHLMERAHIILTDSGGIQEEAPAIGKPVLVMRDKTERPEAIEAGTAKLVGTDFDRIVRETERLLNSPRAYARMARAANPFGDGRAARRIAGVLARTRAGDRGR